MAIDYTGDGWAFPKGTGTPKQRKDRRNRDARTVAADDRVAVFERQKYGCFAWGISPVCTGRVRDPHELIPVSKGGKRESWNRVGLCRSCHDATDSTMGGRRLFFDWPGKAERKPPNADKRGQVTCRWQERGTR
jgi:5-methylcytosine-specific restriction endonuclease McrA